MADLGFSEIWKPKYPRVTQWYARMQARPHSSRRFIGRAHVGILAAAAGDHRAASSLAGSADVFARSSIFYRFFDRVTRERTEVQIERGNCADPVRRFRITDEAFLRTGQKISRGSGKLVAMRRPISARE